MRMATRSFTALASRYGHITQSDSNKEQGADFTHSWCVKVAARAIAGDPDSAYDTFARVMTNGFAENQFWGAASNWVNGTLSSEPLNNSVCNYTHTVCA